MLPTPLSNFDIMTIIGPPKGPDDFRGVVMRDEPIEPTGHYIINLDSHDRPGTHWVALYRRGTDSLYFDSFGMPPPEEVIRASGRIFYSDNRIQPMTSDMCGYYAIAFILQMEHGKSLYDFIHQFDSWPTGERTNDNILRRLLKNLKI